MIHFSISGYFCYCNLMIHFWHLNCENFTDFFELLNAVRLSYRSLHKVGLTSTTKKAAVNWKINFRLAPHVDNFPHAICWFLLIVTLLATVVATNFMSHCILSASQSSLFVLFHLFSIAKSHPHAILGRDWWRKWKRDFLNVTRELATWN